MKTIQLADLNVHRLGFGAMRVCGPNVWGPPKDRAAAHAVLRKAVALGVNFFDTADSYGPHVDEELIAEVLQACEKLGVAFLPWYPLGAGGVLKSEKIKSLAKKNNAAADLAALQ